MHAVQPWTCQVTISATCIHASTGRTYSQVQLRQSSISRSSYKRTVWGIASIVKPRRTVRRDCTTVESVTHSAADWRVCPSEGREAIPVLWQVSPDRTTARISSHLPLISAELYTNRFAGLPATCSSQVKPLIRLDLLQSYSTSLSSAVSFSGAFTGPTAAAACSQLITQILPTPR